MNNKLKSILENNREWTGRGNVATYIPELSTGNRDALGIYIVTCDGEEFSAGDIDEQFTIQSISKVITLICALEDYGSEEVFKKISAEPTADAFNSIINLETKNYHKPLNPMINSGAIATVSMLKGKSLSEKYDRVVSLIRELSQNQNITLNEKVYMSENKTGNRNRSIAYFMKSTGVIDGDIEECLTLYFLLCSLNITCKDISKIASVIANKGVLPWNGKRVFKEETANITKAIMLTCGMYDASGEFSIMVGIPAKSGVGGGIMAVVPNRMGIGVIGPSLDEKGNSIAGVKLLKDLSKEYNLSIFA